MSTLPTTEQQLKFLLESMEPPRQLDDYTDDQKTQLIEGMLNQVKIAVYADPAFDAFQMREIRKGLEQKLDVSAYAHPEIRSAQMGVIRQGLLDGVDLSGYTHLLAGEMLAIRQALDAGITDTSWFDDGRFDEFQIRALTKGLKKGLDISPIANPDLEGSQMAAFVAGENAFPTEDPHPHHNSYADTREEPTMTTQPMETLGDAQDAAFSVTVGEYSAEHTSEELLIYFPLKNAELNAGLEAFKARTGAPSLAITDFPDGIPLDLNLSSNADLSELNTLGKALSDLSITQYNLMHDYIHDYQGVHQFDSPLEAARLALSIDALEDNFMPTRDGVTTDEAIGEAYAQWADMDTEKMVDSPYFDHENMRFRFEAFGRDLRYEGIVTPVDGGIFLDRVEAEIRDFTDEEVVDIVDGNWGDYSLESEEDMVVDDPETALSIEHDSGFEL